MDVRLPDGTIIQNIPDDTSKAELIAKLKSNGYDTDSLERMSARQQGQQAVQKQMASESDEYVDVPVYDAAGNPTMQTERIARPGGKVQYLAEPFAKGVVASIPFGEDVYAAIRSKSINPMSPEFQQEKERVLGEAEAFKEKAPGAYYSGAVAGMAPQMLLPMGLAGKGAGFFAKTGIGALEGAGYGALTGLGEGVTGEERLKSAAGAGALGGVLGGALGRFAAPAEKAAAPVVPEGVAAAERLGVPLPIYAAIDNPMVQRATKISENVPFAGEPIISAREGAIKGLSDAVDRLVPQTTSEQAGQSIGEGIKNWMTSGVREKAKNAYDEVKNLMENPDAMKPLENTRNVISEIMAQRANAKLEGAPAAINLVSPAIKSVEGLNYDGAKTLYTALRDLRSENIIKGVKDANTERVYNALKQDVLDIAEEAGGEPARLFLQKADRQYQQMSEMRKQLTKIVGKTEGNISDEKVFDRLFNAAKEGGSANNKLVQRALSVMDNDALKAFQAGIISNIGRDAQGKFSPDRWLGAKGINALSERAKTLIFKDEPELLKSLNDISAVSERFKNLNKFGNPSGTGQNVFGAAAFLHPVTALKTLVSANVFTRIMSKPASAKAFADWSKRYETFVRNPTKVTGNLAYRAGENVSRYISNETGKPVDFNAHIQDQ